MTKNKRNFYKRLTWYFIGFILFYAPFALFERALSLFMNTEGRLDVHVACLRCGLLGITGGIKMDILSIRIIATLVLLVSAFFVGPVFCRFFCVAGAIAEYLSRIVPSRLKVNWQKHINPVPVKYGILTGFIISPFLGMSVACSYCNFSLFQRITSGLSELDIGVLSSTNIITLFTWLIILGAFSKGGRGFCSYLCPVGAAQSLLHSIGSRFRFTYKLTYTAQRCSSCGRCTLKCPMGALQITKDGLKYQVHNCITCNECVNVCTKNALTYGSFESGSLNVKRQYRKINKGKENEIH